MTLGMASVLAQPPIGVPVPPLGNGPFILDTAEQHKIRVTVVTKGLSHPWSLAFLPDGNMLVTERPGRMRIVRDGKLDPRPISGVPAVLTMGNSGLMDVAEAWGVDETSVSMVAMPLFHIGGSGWANVALARGGTDVLVPMIDPAALVDSIERDGITKDFFKAGDRLRIWASPNRNPNDNRIRIKRMERRRDKWKWGGNRIETR